ncbi:MAG TPA: amidohydrolase family protein [Sumerlaeia bacterium]|nr:amidohydrolase family protein [Sumerlaeia bacterium]
MIADAHHHFWKYNTKEYGWINDAMAKIRRDFLPTDLKKVIDAAGVDGVVSVQARQNVEETQWLLDMAGEHDFLRGVVGWVPLADPGVRECLDRFAPHPKFKGVRHVLHDEPDDAHALREDFNAGVRMLREYGLAYDILIFERHLPATIEFVDRHPEQRFIVDHIAKPRIRENVLSPWRKGMMELGRRENVVCKVSGMVTEADYAAWTEEQLRPYFDVVLEAFGPRRLAFGSDWPVCEVACPYGKWFSIVKGFIFALSPTEQDWILGGTAREAYKL